jgi:hypothetical protein
MSSNPGKVMAGGMGCRINYQSVPLAPDALGATLVTGGN